MSQIFDSVRDGAACMVEPAWMRATRALAWTKTDRSAEPRWTEGVSDWRDGGAR